MQHPTWPKSFCQSAIKPWVEQSFPPNALAHLHWLDSHLYTHQRYHPTIMQTASVLVQHSIILFSQYSTTLISNMENILFWLWRQAGFSSVCHFCNLNDWQFSANLFILQDPCSIRPWRAVQLQHFLPQLLSCVFCNDRSPSKTLFLGLGTVHHILSSINLIMLALYDQSTPFYLLQWKSDHDLTISPTRDSRYT